VTINIDELERLAEATLIPCPDNPLKPAYLATWNQYQNASNPAAILALVRELRLLRDIEKKRSRVIPGSNCEICGDAGHTNRCPYKQLDALRVQEAHKLRS